MKRTITKSLALAVLMAALAPVPVWAQNVAAPATGGVNPTAPAMKAMPPQGATKNRAMAVRTGGKWRHRAHHRNMYWRSATTRQGTPGATGVAKTHGAFTPAANSAATGTAATTAKGHAVTNGTKNPAGGQHDKALHGKHKAST